MEESPAERLSPVSAYLKMAAREPIRRHHSLKYIFNGESVGQGARPGSRTPPAHSALPHLLGDRTRHHSLTRLKDLTSGALLTRTREVAFTVPPTVSPLSPRRGLGECSPLTPRRMGSGDTTPVGSQAGSEYGGDSRATTPSPGPFRGSFTDLSAMTGAASGLGGINPELYKTDELEGDLDQYPEDHIGRVWLQLEYHSEAEKLLVTLIKAKNLPSRLIGSINSCDPYVRLYLMPDERRYLQTKIRKKTCNPRFDETFGFQVTAKELEDRALKLTFYDVDRDKKHQVIGHVLILLKELGEWEGKRLLRRDLEREVSLSPRELGQMEVSLGYNDNLERLTVTVGDSMQLKVEKELRQEKNEFQVRISLMHQAKVVKTKKTAVVKSGDSPSFNESFHFKVTPDALDTTSVSMVVTVGKKSDNVVGRVQMGSFMFARGRALEHWNQMLAKKRQQVKQWHTLS
ncbi:synaptotagmin-15-like isoform X1 [Portunus trituberculatus]|uniref:synaptotagmin-15-like isoform X1 n=1 Tax=Portunus trituberculatus TaxID=210409 RepID=UPI001E1CDEEF|nr:synaptotagmin-15-like isoform X1 [Portunus trituberculatus]